MSVERTFPKVDLACGIDGLACVDGWLPVVVLFDAIYHLDEQGHRVLDRLDGRSAVVADGNHHHVWDQRDEHHQVEEYVWPCPTHKSNWIPSTERRLRDQEAQTKRSAARVSVEAEDRRRVATAEPLPLSASLPYKD